MLKKIVLNYIEKFERQTGYDASYMKDIAHSSPSLAMKFSKLSGLHGEGKFTPNEVMQTAKLAAMKTEDCGPCLQLQINFSLWSGMEPELVKNAVEAPEKLPQELAIVHDFGVKTSNNEPVEEIRLQLLERYGQDAMIEMALAIATCKVYPVVKRGMGQAKSCSLMQFDFGEQN